MRASETNLGAGTTQTQSFIQSIHEPTDEELIESNRLYQRVRGLTVVLPAAFVLMLLVLTILVLDRVLPPVPAITFAFAISAFAIAIFSRRVFSVIESLRQGILAQNAELRLRSAQLRAVHEAGVSITADLSLDAVLQKVVDTSRAVVGARYGALAVIDNDGRITEFITSGLSADEASLVGSHPTGNGLIGHILRSGKPYRTDDIASDAHAAGVPAWHPTMTSFLGAPLIYKGRVVGNLYLTDKASGPFTEQDQDAILAFAVQAAVAIENARLYEQVQENVVLQERERIGMELHDGTIQAIYGVGLKLEDCIQRVRTEPEMVERELDEAIEGLNRVIREIRNYIFDLRPIHLQEGDLLTGLGELLRETRVNTLIDVELEMEPDAELGHLNENQRWQLLQIAREALANIQKHAQATLVRIEIFTREDCLTIKVTDDGRGFSENGGRAKGGHGLQNMAERANALGGRLVIESTPGKGTSVIVELPRPQAPVAANK